jgi:hypothetical protein
MHLENDKRRQVHGSLGAESLPIGRQPRIHFYGFTEFLGAAKLFSLRR